MKREPLNTSGFRTAIIISAIIHIAAIAGISLAPELRFAFMDERPIRISAVWVELPRGTSDEIGLGLKKAKSLPQSTIEEQKRLFQPEEPKQVSLKPKMTSPEPAEPEDKKKDAVGPSKRPKVDMEATRKNVPEKEPKPDVKRKSTDKRIRDALAKIDRELSGRTVVPEAAQIKEDHDGYKYGTSSEPLKVSPSDPEYLKYQAMVRAKIIGEWIVPLRFTEDGGERLNARLEVLINVDGEVVSIRWNSPSGNATYDQSAIRAVKKASPFPKPPDRLAWEAYNEGFLIEFDPGLKASY